MLTNYSAYKLLKYGYQNLISMKKSLVIRNNLFISKCFHKRNYKKSRIFLAFVILVSFIVEHDLKSCPIL